MKTRIFTILFSVFCVLTFAQITVTDADLLDIGDVIYLADDDNTIVNLGNTGQNATWDF